jgi:hypothetical protein
MTFIRFIVRYLWLSQRFLVATYGFPGDSWRPFSRKILDFFRVGQPQNVKDPLH